MDGPTWLAAVARGPATGLAPAGLAHTTPVYVDVDGVRVARAGAAEWCLGLVDGLERLLAEHGVFADGAAGAPPRRLRRAAGDGPALLPRRG